MQIIERIFPQYIDRPLIIVLISIFINIFSYQLVCLSYYHLFKKFNEKPILAFIPLYNLYLILKHTSDTKHIKTAIILTITTTLLEITTYTLQETLINKFHYIYYIFLIVEGVFALLLAIHNLKISIDLAKSFNKNIYFAIGLAFLPFIFNLILGLGSSKYIGNVKKMPETNK